jgi:hypothetical protein
MNHYMRKYGLMAGLAAALWLCNGGVGTDLPDSLVATADARLGRPATPVSYAGVARRTTVRVATPGVGAPGVGVTPGVGAGAPGVGVTPGVNAGGPVNRVGVR